MNSPISAAQVAKVDQELAKLNAYLDEELQTYRRNLAEHGEVAAGGLFVYDVANRYGAQSAAGLLLALVRRMDPS